MSRQQDRQGFDEPTRLALLESDVDHVYKKHDVLAAKDEALEERFNMEIDSLRKLIIGMCVVIATSSLGTMITMILTNGG